MSSIIHVKRKNEPMNEGLNIISGVNSNLEALIVDDEPQIRSLITDILRAEGWITCEASSALEALDLLPKHQWSLIICDVVLGGSDGYSVLRSFVEQGFDARFVLMTGKASAAGALDATAIGAYDYLIKPFTVDDIVNLANSISENNKLRSKHKKSNAVPKDLGYVSDIPLIGKSPKFVECLKLVGRVAATSLPVLITGDSGTGKEVVARAIHQRSNLASNSFVAVNCGAIPVELIESELFGHSRGSFTGAERERIGLWEEADGGTIFLDEITETSLLFQVKLLRVLQQNEIRRVGSNRTIRVNARVIAATNRNIEEEVKHGRFRQDLMYRLNAVTINLPPLRDRAEDIPLLAEFFAERIRPAEAAPVSFSPAALEILENYNWQGNIRELENAVLHAVSLADDVIYPEHLPTRILTSSATDLPEPTLAHKNEWQTLADMEARYVIQVLAHTGGNKQAAARLLNIDRKTLTRIIERSETPK